jgi:type VI secretion system protein VasG
MASLNLKGLISKLNPICRQSLEGAAGLCLSRTNYNVEVEHWLAKLVEPPNTDVAAIFRYYGVNVSRLMADLTRSIDRLKTGNSRPPVLSPHTIDWARDGWMLASIEFGAVTTRSGYLLLALLQDPALARLAHELSDELAKISPESLLKDLPHLIAETDEAESGPNFDADAAASGASPGERPPQGNSRTPALDQFTIDLTARARSGKIDAVVGRDNEIRQVIDILTRRRQNNPILTGEAGVGKTAVVEGFAQRIAIGDVPPSLRNVSVRVLDLGLLQAGAGIKGEFENRLKNVIDEVSKSPKPVVLFIDEAHTMIGAGGQAGQGDAANLLKPALARGELRTIAATTWAEYKKYFEKDAALARRFQVVKVEEPTEPVAINMMRGLQSTLEAHHGVEILDEAVQEAVRLSHRYLSGRQLPDKAVSLLDTACARVAIGHSATPPAIEDCQRNIEQLSIAVDVLNREQASGSHHGERLEELSRQKSEALRKLEELSERWNQEQELVKKIRELRQKLTSNPLEAASSAEPASAKVSEDSGSQPLNEQEALRLKEELAGAKAKLEEIQGESPLMQPYVDAQSIATVVSGWTGIPVGRMVTNEIKTVLNLKHAMERRIVGQSHALEAIAQRIRTSRASLTDPRRPIGVFFLVGPSGVGKTETAITLAELLYGGAQNMTVINMSEFKEEHKVSMLMGSPPGYVGYGEGGVLTEAVRRRPYSVVLLDEMEKAHPGVQDVFYQVFDKGMLRDGEGRDIDFKNTVLLMTSNAATDTIAKLCADPETMPSPEGLAEALHPELLKSFKPAFLGRVTVVPYFPLSDDIMRQITELQLGRVAERIHQNYRADFAYRPEVVSHVVSRCVEVASGARNVDRILSGTLLPELAGEFLSRMSEGTPITAVEVGVDPAGKFTYAIS